MRADESQIRVDAHGVSLGRALGNDVVVKNPAVSQLHAIVHLGPYGPEILPFGRNGTRVNGEVVEAPVQLVDGDRIEVPGELFTVRVEGLRHADRFTLWGLARSDGTLYGIRRVMRVGGDAEADDLVVPGWPSNALTCSPVHGALVLQLGAEARIAGSALRIGELRLATSGDEVEIGGVVVRLVGETRCGHPTTAATPEDTLPAGVVFSFLPTGARLTLTFDRRESTLRLSEVRARLVATLLGAGVEVRPGEWVVDDVVIPQVWPRQDGKTRVDVNILVHRLRRDLLKLGLNPFAVVEREECATRFLVAPGGTVRIE